MQFLKRLLQVSEPIISFMFRPSTRNRGHFQCQEDNSSQKICSEIRLHEAKGPITVVSGKRGDSPLSNVIKTYTAGSFGFEMVRSPFHTLPASIHNFDRKHSNSRRYSKVIGILTSSGCQPDTEIMNLSRFISALKFRPLIFRYSHRLRKPRRQLHKGQYRWYVYFTTKVITPVH